jgi:hypothetical protein
MNPWRLVFDQLAGHAFVSLSEQARTEHVVET